jgi:hypothetical protein
MPLSETDTSGKFIIPKLQAAGWDNDPHSIAEQRSVMDRRIIPAAKGFIRRPYCKLDRKNPSTRNSPVRRSPEEPMASILNKEQRIVEIAGRIKALQEKSL